MHHLTARWAGLTVTAAPSVYVATFLVERRENWSPEDYLGSAVAGFADDQDDVLLDADVTRGSTCSVRLRFLAPDESVARTWGESAMREAGRMAYSVSSFTLRKGRPKPGEIPV